MTSPLLERLYGAIATPVAQELYRAVADGRRSVALRILRDEGFSLEEQKALHREFAQQFRGAKVRLEEIAPAHWAEELAKGACLGRYAGCINTTVPSREEGVVIYELPTTKRRWRYGGGF
jgi:hypothetical protein